MRVTGVVSHDGYGFVLFDSMIPGCVLVEQWFLCGPQ